MEEKYSKLIKYYPDIPKSWRQYFQQGLCLFSLDWLVLFKKRVYILQGKTRSQIVMSLQKNLNKSMNIIIQLFILSSAV